MNKSLPSADVIAAQLDRLVSGDLPEPDRRSLLAWLDEEPARWRACALAFLEAQVWEQAVLREGEAPAEPWVQGSGFGVQDSVGREQRAEGREQRTEGRGHWSTVGGRRSGFRFDWLAIAGAVLLAFTAGTLAGRSTVSRPDARPRPTIAQDGPIPAATGPQLATVSVRTNLDPRLMAQVQLPVEPADQPLAGATSISEYDRKQWERRGFELVEETRYLPAKMPDGRPVMVPVNRVHLKPKGTPVS